MKKLNKIKIGNNYPTFIIAEISANHNQSLKSALKMIDQASKCGVSAVKIQTYTPDEMTIQSAKGSFFIKDKNSIWKGQKLYDLYKKGTTPREWHKKLFQYARKKKIILFSTPFSTSAVDFLETFKPPIYKISSFECNDFELIARVARTKKPIIISTGMASIKEISECVNVAKKNGAKKIILLKCTSTYPAPHKDLNLRSIAYLKKKFNCDVGFSDHSLGLTAPVISVACGATVIEKHFKINEKGLDSKFSINSSDMKRLVDECRIAKASLGKIFLGTSKSEKNNTKYKRSLFLVKDIKKGEKITKKHIKSIRGGYGAAPKFLNFILNKKAKKNFLSPKPFKLQMLS